MAYALRQATPPLLLRHIDMPPAQERVLAPGDAAAALAPQRSAYLQQRLDADNYRRYLELLLGAGDFPLDVAVDVTSTALIELVARATHRVGEPLGTVKRRRQSIGEEQMQQTGLPMHPGR